jgi:hypothetical protein
MKPRAMHLCLATLLVLIASLAWAKDAYHPQAADDVPSDVASAWFDLLYDVVKTEQSAPPVAARTYGLTAVALYEAIVPGSRAHTSLVHQLNDFSSVPRPTPHQPYHWPTVANAAFAHAIRGLFPGASPDSLDAISTQEQTFAMAFQRSVPPPVYAHSVAHGRAVAEAVLAWAATDGYATLNNCPYTPPMGPGLWVPTPPLFTPNPLQPCWGQVRPLVLTAADECAPLPPPAYSRAPTSAFYANALEVYQTNLTLTDEQTTIAEYWADNAGATGHATGPLDRHRGPASAHPEPLPDGGGRGLCAGWPGGRGRLYQLLADQVYVYPTPPRDLHSESHRSRLDAPPCHPELPLLYLRPLHPVRRRHHGPHRHVRRDRVHRHVVPRS